MWRRTCFLYLLVLYHYCNSQPIESENVRQSRQMDAGECCPCPGSVQRSLDQLSPTSLRQGMIDSPQDLDDCPCRFRQADTEGASSILFPSAMGAAGTFRKPSEKKEDMKPLLHPEVDLASSVLETLREATNEEYREALERDAVRDAGKIAGLSDATFRDAAPEESRSIVTIIMNPKEDFEDDIPQASDVQESRCVHAPLGSAGSSLGNLKEASSRPLVKETGRLPKSGQPGLLHNNNIDIDSNVGASNVQERLVNLDKEVTNSKDAGLLKINPSSSLINNDDDCNDTNTYSKSPLISNVLKYPFSSPLDQNTKTTKIGQSSTVPTKRLESTLFGNKNNEVDNNDLSVLPSKVEEKVSEREHSMIKEIPSFRKPTLKNILENTRPFNLKNLLKLKDVELIPSVAFDKPKTIVQPTLFPPYALSSKNNAVQFNQRDKSQLDLTSNRENNLSDRKIISSNEDCSTEAEENETRNIHIIKKEPINTETEMLDTVPNTSNTVFSVDKDQTSDGCESHETPNADSNKLVLPMTLNENESSTGTTQNDETNISKNNCESDEKHYSRTTSDNENSEHDVIENDFNTDEKHCSRTTNDNESLEIDARVSDRETDEKNVLENSNNNHYFKPNCNSNHLEPKEQQKITEEKNLVPEESSIRENQDNIQNDIVETTTTKYNLLKPIPLDKTLLSIKEKIKDTLESLKHINTDIKGLSNQNKYNIDVPAHSHNETQLSKIKIKPNLDCISDKSEQVITTLKPKSYTGDDFNQDDSTSNSVTIQELQNKSDSILQMEGISEITGKESEKLDSETSANTQTVGIILPGAEEDDTIYNDNSDNLANVCPTSLPKGISTQEINLQTTNRDKNGQTVMDATASNLVIDKLSQDSFRPLGKILEDPFSVDDIQQIPLLNSELLSVLKTPFSNIRDIIKLNPLPTLDEIKLKVSNIFNTNVRDVQEDTPQNEDYNSFSPSKIKPTMATDASTTNFQVKQPPHSLFDRENLNLDIFQLRPITRPISNIRAPALGLDSYKAKLALPNNLSLKPIKFDSSLGNTEGILGSRSALTLFPNDIHGIPKVSDVFDDIVERLPSFVKLRDIMRSNTQEWFNTPSFLENIDDKLDLSDLKHQAENSVKNIQQKLKAAGNDLNVRIPVISSHSLLETIAEKQEDLNDKLKAVHIDFNDRLESMRNSLINPTYLSNGRKETNIRSLSNSNNNNKDRPILLKSRTPAQVSTRNESPLRSEAQRKVKTTIPALDQWRFKMPAAASLPVSKTVEVPKLKVTPAEYFKPMTKDATSFKYTSKNTEPPADRTSTILAKQAINHLKNSKVKVSFSTTLPPLTLQSFKSRLTSTEAPISKLKSSSREKAVTDSGTILSDSNIALTEAKPLAMLAPEANINNRHRLNVDENDTEEDKTNPNLLQSRPRATESYFLTKVKEAVSARLPKANAAKKTSISNKIDNHPADSDMLRSASVNLETNTEEPLKENVSYKCKMVCHRD